MKMQTEVLIVGGSFNGLALAIALAKAGISVILVEQSALTPTLSPEFDGRASAINHSSVEFLKSLNLLDELNEYGQPIWDIRVCGGSPGNLSPLFLHFDHAAISDEPFGIMWENRHLRHALYKMANQMVKIIAPTSIINTQRNLSSAVVHLDDGRVIETQVIIACDGRGSSLRKGAAIPVIAWDYPQSAIVATVEHETAHAGSAVESFLAPGPFAILPLTGNRSSLVWCERAAHTAAILQLNQMQFDDEICRRFGDYLGKVKSVGKRFSYPLSFQLATRLIDTRLALVGDAAHVIHPVAGQGLNLGFSDVARLTAILLQHKLLGLDLGSETTLTHYQTSRRFNTLLLGVVTDALIRLFSNDSKLLHSIRTLGLAGVEQIPALKKFFMNEARSS